VGVDFASKVKVALSPLIGDERPPFSTMAKGGDLRGEVGDITGELLGVGIVDSEREDFLPLCTSPSPCLGLDLDRPDGVFARVSIFERRASIDDVRGKGTGDEFVLLKVAGCARRL
jgi:hypothetical protein